MEVRNQLQTLQDVFSSMQYWGTSVSLKTWFDEDHVLRFFMTNGPVNNKKPPLPPESPGSQTVDGSLSRVSSSTPKKNGQSPPSPKTARHQLPADSLNVSIMEPECNVEDTNEDAAVPNVSTRNRFECLSDVDQQIAEHIVQHQPKDTQTEIQNETKATQYVSHCANWRRNCSNVDNLIPRFQLCKPCFQYLQPKTYEDMDPFKPPHKMTKSYKKYLYMENQIRPW